VDSARGPGLRRWQGTLRARIVVRRHGRLAERCAMRATWLAMPEGIGTGRFEFTEARSEEDGGTETAAYASPAATVSAIGTREVVGFEVETPDDRRFDGTFRAPALNRLQAGQRYDADGSTPGAASGSVTGTGLCSASGDFTVTAIRFDRLRRLVQFAATFEGTCYSPDAVVRGSLEWRAAA
jgi:hypothetical protein